MDYQNIIVENKDCITFVTINRPQALNALNTVVLTELSDAFDKIGKDKKIKVVIITGAGEKAFVAGADIAEMVSKNPLQAREFTLLGHDVMKKIEKLPQPVIAAIKGYALGGGCELALACDIRVAAENAKFGQPEVGLGITPGFGGTQRLSRLVGRGRAGEILMTARIVLAEEALNIGLANYVVTSEKVIEKALEIAKTISEKGTIAVQMTKAAVLSGLSMDLDRALDMEADVCALCFSTDEQKEGMEAFLSKRKPVFKGV